MDLGNAVLKLCQDGMRAEAEGHPDEAKALFLEAWGKNAATITRRASRRTTSPGTRMIRRRSSGGTRKRCGTPTRSGTTG